jgi:hypothetical protein
VRSISSAAALVQVAPSFVEYCTVFVAEALRHPVFALILRA